MKRKNNLFPLICSIENLRLADSIARKGKKDQHGVIVFDRDSESNILKLHVSLINKTYSTSTYSLFTIHEPKERVISKLPYFPDRIVHHGAMNILEWEFVSTFTADTYSCIKGRGIRGATTNLRKALTDYENTTYCLKLDIKKFYPSIDHDILKKLLRRKFKDQDLLWLLDEIIDSSPGVPIGNYLSQYFANFYLAYFDHWIKEQKHVKYYFRYADDMVFLSNDKKYLHQLLSDIRAYLCENLKLTIKGNYQVFPVDDKKGRGIDFVGYVHFHTHVLLRKSIKKNFARMIKKNKNKQSIASYNGWAQHGDCKHLLKKLLAA
jgi:RNA-directed DNA polymerase